eukprot:564210_1
MTKTNVTQVPELHTRVSRPLPHFHPQDICNHIQKLVLNDMNHHTQLAETQAIFANHTFSGQKMIDLETVVHRDLWKNEAQHPLYEEITSKTAEEMTHVLFHYPLNSLLKRIIHENIDRSQLIASLTMEQHHENTFHIIVTETGPFYCDITRGLDPNLLVIAAPYGPKRSTMHYRRISPKSKTLY